MKNQNNHYSINIKPRSHQLFLEKIANKLPKAKQKQFWNGLKALSLQVFSSLIKPVGI